MWVMTAVPPLPASRGRPRAFDADDVVARAMDAFWTNGYHGTSLPDLLQATNLSRGSLYGAFGDKRGLFLQALDRYVDQSLARFDDDLDPRQGAAAGLRACLAGYVSRTSGAAGRRGCLVVATAMELASHDAEVERRLGRFFKAAEAKLAGALRRAQAEGGLAGGVDPGHAARALLGLAEGLRVIAKTGIDRATWQGTVDAMLDRFLT